MVLLEMPALLVVFTLVVVFSLCESSFAQEDEFCTQTDGEKGLCIPIGGCSHARNLLEMKVRPQTCGFAGMTPLVCCPLAGIRSKKHCGKYHQFDYTRDGPIYILAAVGGENSLAQEFPHMAALGFGDINNIQWNCGGTLISEQYVLTAAHCIYSSELGYVKWVRLGDLNLEITTDDAEVQDFEVESYIRHPDYRPPSRYNDIALIKLNRAAKLTNYVTPACLDTRTNLSATYPVATGWGRLSYAGDTSPHLQKVALNYFSREECNKVYANTSARQLGNGINPESQICAGGRNVAKDTCQGDSGGPLQVQNEIFVHKPFNVVGITSFGKGCGQENIPAVYTKVSYYVPWIEDIVWPVN